MNATSLNRSPPHRITFTAEVTPSTADSTTFHCKMRKTEHDVRSRRWRRVMKARFAAAAASAVYLDDHGRESNVHGSFGCRIVIYEGT